MIILKFKCSVCDEGQYYNENEKVECPYCGAGKDKQNFIEQEDVDEDEQPI